MSASSAPRTCMHVNSVFLEAQNWIAINDHFHSLVALHSVKGLKNPLNRMPGEAQSKF